MARITRVRLENYKSIKFCDVRLEPLTVLVGKNGSGKSNFLDALDFLSESLRDSLDIALRNRNGLYNLLHKSQDKKPVEYFRIYVEFECFSYRGFYDVKIGSEYILGGVREITKVLSEELEIYGEQGFSVSEEEFRYFGIDNLPNRDSSRLFFVRMSGEGIFEEIFDFLSELRFYNPIPESIKYPQKVSGSSILSKDGSNIALALRNQIYPQDSSESVFDKIEFYLNKVNPDIVKIESGFSGSENQSRITFYSGNSRMPLQASEMSDGTLRALVLLTAIFQRNDFNQPIFFIGIEEPETGLHPAILSIFLQAIREASQETQVILTTHSPDLLEHLKLENSAELVLAVEIKGGQTIIAPIDAASREIVRRKLYTLGDLLRMNQLEPDTLNTKELI
jgi:predicted ATPase